MPLIRFLCSACDHEENKMVAPKEIKDLKNKQPCPKCGAVDSFVRQLGSPNSSIKMTMDNGIQARAVEVPKDIVEQIEDRNKRGRRG